ncbi:MAG TPA: ABC transporter ATP-binding protein [Pyrinomonadaceae bacterium]|nr:ABC transporter ATP-binding protein [Pyrinomonadaceae bacterium]
MSTKILTARDVSHSFGGAPVLDRINVEVAAGEVIAFVGPSGCGKTTLLRLFSGFYRAERGSVERGGDTRMIYQQNGLLPWLTVAENISLGLRHVKDAAARAEQSERLLQLIRLQGFARHYPHQLSGGMRQRVELARALAGDTSILLMDEPFSSLDYQTRARMRAELTRVLTERPVAVVLVTHDIEEAVLLADRVLVLSERPAHVICELRPEGERPRDVTSLSLRAAMKTILEHLSLPHSFDGDAPEGEGESVGQPEASASPG